MDKKEKKLLEKMKQRMKGIFTDQIKEGVTHEWAMSVFDAIKKRVEEGISKGILEGYHADVDFEFVNRPEFFDLVKEQLSSIKGPHWELNIAIGKTSEIAQRTVSEQMITVFVHLFREWYNERD